MSKRTRKKMPSGEFAAVIESLNHEGRGVTHLQGKATFLFNALPAESVLFRYTHCHRQLDEGITTQIINASPDRVTQRCQHFGVCGGCALQQLSPEKQRAHKQKILLEHLKHQAQCEPVLIEDPLHTDPWGYRRRARLSARFVTKKNKVLLGFRERESHFVTDVQQCETLHPAMGLKISTLGALLSTLSIRSEIPQIEIAIGDTEKAMVVRHMVAIPNEDQEKLVEFATENQWQLYFQPGDQTSIHAIFPSTPAELFYDLPAQSIRMYFKPLQFTKINADVNRLMITRAIDWLQLQKEDRVLDLFCGIGNFSLPIARFVSHVIGIEGSLSSIVQAKENALRNQINHADFDTHDLTKPLPQTLWASSRFDKILLDPPRAGAAEIIESMHHWKPRRIVYISCNPITLARDAKTLLQLGYTIEKTCIVDMFPHTDHIEAMALFTHEHVS